MSKRIPRLSEVFKVREAMSNLPAQLKTATPTNAALLNQQSQDALKNQRNTIQGVTKTQGAKLKISKTDPQNPIANIFVSKPDGSADVLDKTTGQLKPVPGIGAQDNKTTPMKNAGVFGTS